ncbi:MAG: BMP family ABC transporter substrate-binding protein, partial [Clostridia bacterium]|nr:BMP family ABC transporter substrate-binding protein [Clostridia bacterium]
MKKILSLFLVAVMLFGCCAMFASCGGGKDPGEVKAALIALHGTSSTYDKNFIEAFEKACQNKGLLADNYTIITDIPEGTECYDAAADFADDGYDVIFADSFGHEEYMLKAAKEFPNVQFCHATGTTAHTENVANFQNSFAAIYEGRYLAGVAAGMKLIEMYGEDITAEEAKVGYVAAWPYAEVISGYTSWFLGVRSIVPNATMEVRYTNSWYDEAGEMATAEALIEAGCTLISQHADSMGAPTACENAGVPNVAYNGTTGKTNTFIIASKINWVPYFEYMLDCVIQGKDIDTDYTGTIASKSVEITALGTAAAAGTQAKLDAVKAQLADGSLKVFDCSKFTVKNAKADTSDFSKAGYITMDADGHLTAYNADVDSDAAFAGDTNVIKTENGVTYFAESAFRSAP